jgi:hypothetical protein
MRLAEEVAAACEGVAGAAELIKSEYAWGFTCVVVCTGASAVVVCTHMSMLPVPC